MKPTEDFSIPRRAILGAWDPLYIKLPDKDRKHLEKLWQELRDVESIGAWSAFSGLTGKLVEALLKERLLLGGYYDIPALSGKTLGTLTTMAQSVDLLPGYDDPPTGKSAITAARTLRNWASHSSLWYDYPTERRASQSLIVAVCIVESLFPRDPPEFQSPVAQDDLWWIENTRSIAPGKILSQLEASPDGPLARHVRSSPLELYRQVLRYGTSSSVAKLLQISYDLEFDQDLLRQAVYDSFVWLVSNASRSSFRPFTELLWRLRLLGLGACATLFSILLPFDLDLLIKLLNTRAEAWVARYVNEAFRAEPQVFASITGNPKRTNELAIAFWQTFGAGTGNILNMANILGTLPYDVRAALLQRAEASVLPDWVAASAPRNAVNLLRSLSDQIVGLHPRLNDLRQAVLTSLATQIRVAAPSQLHELPLRFVRFNMDSDNSSVAVLREVLKVVQQYPKPESEWMHARRIVWDCYALIEPLRSEAADTALRLLEQEANVPAWVAYCFRGLLDLEAGTSVRFSVIPLDEGVFLKCVADPDLDRWQRFLAAVGYWRLCAGHASQFPDRAKAILRVLRNETQEPRQVPSRKLLERIDQLLALA